MELERIGVATGHKNKLAAKGIESVEDLLAYMPRKYNDFTKITGILPPDRQSCILIRIKNVSYHAARNNSSKNADMVLCTGFELDTGKAVSLQWFNSNWMYDRVRATRYDKVFIAGKFTFDAKFNNYSCVNPDVFTDDVGDGMKVYPVYSKIQGISNNWLIDHLELAAQSDAAKEETVPEDILTAVNLSGMAATYRYLHHPASMDEVEKGKERILFNDLLDFALRNEYALRQNSFGSQYNIKTLELYNAVRHNLAFALTPDQDAAIQTIISTAREGKRVNSLLSADVGAGKTVVAQLAAACFAGSGYQVAILAPTQILAKQHFEDFKAMFEPFGVKVVLADSSIKKKAEKQELYHAVESGDAQIIVGTHAVFGREMVYRNLACIVSDEEHKFGVSQRNALIEKASEGVHTISMSATPIPRTLASVMYGDAVQLLSIETMPAGRLPVKTGLARSREAIYSFLKSEISNGRQAYVVCPMIEKNEKLDGVKSVEEIFKEYTDALGPHGIRIGVVTGQTKKEESSEIIESFRRGDLDLLIATTVIEVGVNVPNASAIVIHNAERFGLAGLHQLRGRVGRGKYQSYCVLESAEKTGPARLRLEALCRTNSGFKIAEADLQLRGAGELLGTQQSGKNKYLGLILAYPEVYRQAQETAKILLDRGLNCCKATSSILTDRLSELA